MSEPAYRVTGGRELRRTLRQAGSDLQELKQAHQDAATIAARAAARIAPKRTGRLSDTIRSAGTNTAGVIRAGYARVPYAGPVHWGWKSRPRPAKGWRGGPIAPNPFLSDGAQQSENRWIPVYETAIEKITNTVKGA